MGEGHSLAEHSIVLIRGGRLKIFRKLNIILSGANLMLLSVVNRKTSRSKYGVRLGGGAAVAVGTCTVAAKA